MIEVCNKSIVSQQSQIRTSYFSVGFFLSPAFHLYFYFYSLAPPGGLEKARALEVLISLDMCSRPVSLAASGTACAEIQAEELFISSCGEKTVDLIHNSKSFLVC